jgi:CheY-like chemotaxis protein
MTYLWKSVTKDNLTAAFDTIHYSLQRRTRKLLLISESADRVARWEAELGGADLEISSVASGGEALAVVQHRYLDGIVVDVQLTDIPSVQLAEEILKELGVQAPPIMICGPALPEMNIEEAVRSLGRQTVVRFVDSIEHLVEETVLYLHRAEADLSVPQREILGNLRRTDSRLAGKRVLVVDDDVRNIFALTTVLEQHGLQVIHAENGRAGIEALRRTRDVDGVLMDIMMPEMDGYETMRAIRQIPEFRQLPIIAVTAKAMKGDRAKCIEAGASDYITKPVDLEQLFSVLRVWLVACPQPAHAAVGVAH